MIISKGAKLLATSSKWDTEVGIALKDINQVF